MISDMTAHIHQVEEALLSWLQPDNFALMQAIDRSVNEGLFPIEDIKHQIRVLKQNAENGQVSEWGRKSGLTDASNVKAKKVLCLHAGNLPLVGFQTALGVILSGADYYGKISVKDPYLMASFLEHMKVKLPDLEITYSTNLDDFRDLKADDLFFAGSESSVPDVQEKLRSLQAITDHTKQHIRTAKYSMVYLDRKDGDTMKDLAEAILRYEGQGCRSVAMVVSPFGLNSFKCEMTDYIELFWMHNPPEGKVSPAVEYQFAYNKAVERPQAWLDHFLIQESDEMPRYDRVVNWVKGDEETVQALAQKAGRQLQSIYTTGKKIEGLQTELLSRAQRPPFWWKPDGMDVIGVLVK